MFTVLLYVAVYVASHVTDATSGVHHANVYVYCASAALLASACVGTVPYATVVVSIVLQSSFFHVIVYSFTVLSNCAVYVAASVTLTISGLHVLLNVYVYWAVAVFVGVSPL